MDKNEKLIKIWNDMINEIESDNDLSQLPRHNIILYYLGYVQCLFNNNVINANEYKRFMYQISLIN